MTNTSLVFQNTQFDIVDRVGHPWLKSAQIALALGYSREDSISRIYDRNKDEFTDTMTAVVKVPDLDRQFGGPGQNREVRIFSLRGCYAIGMFARTAKAKEFRRWVLDVLEGVTAPSEPVKPCLPPPRYLTKTQDNAVMALMKAKLKHLPWKQQLPAAGDFLSAIKTEFGAPMGQIPRSRFFTLLAYVTAYEVDKIPNGGPH